MKYKQTDVFAFFIDHLDPLGQGVHKESERVTFIPKTLPGETGLAVIRKRSKGVAFAQLLELHTSSPLRIKAECVHYDKCGTCHYLHTDYTSELDFKLGAMQRLTKKINPQDLKITVHAAPKRSAYRERVQLHYDDKNLGYHLPRSNEVLPVPHCLLPEPAVQQEMQKLYERNDWRAALSSKPSGHVELRSTKAGVQSSWNRPYAAGGFTQVFAEMNTLLRQQVADIAHQKSPKAKLLVDLFGGNGNLSHSIESEQKLIVDIGERPSLLPPESRFLALDLFDEEQTFAALKNLNPEILLLDPPRAGIKTLPKIVEELQPKLIIYISCHCATMVRDLTSLQAKLHNQYELCALELFDLFPSTHHFESLAVLKRA